VAPVIGRVPLEPYAVTGQEIETELKRMLPPDVEERVHFEILARKGNVGPRKYSEQFKNWVWTRSRYQREAGKGCDASSSAALPKRWCVNLHVQT